MKSLSITLGVTLALSGTAYAATAPASAPKAPPAWVAESNQDAQIVLKTLAQLSPESAQQLGVDGLDDQATTLPQSLRDTLAGEGYTIGLPEIVQTARSIDGTERYLIRMADGETVETVWMPDGDGGERGDGSQAAEEEEAEDEARQG